MFSSIWDHFLTCLITCHPCLFGYVSSGSPNKSSISHLSNFSYFIYLLTKKIWAGTLLANCFMSIMTLIADKFDIRKQCSILWIIFRPLSFSFHCLFHINVNIISLWYPLRNDRAFAMHLIKKPWFPAVLKMGCLRFDGYED